MHYYDDRLKLSEPEVTSGKYGRKASGFPLQRLLAYRR